MQHKIKPIPQKHDTSKYQNQMERILRDLRNQDVFIVSIKGHGKTVATQNLAMEITKANPNNKLIVFETFPKWCLEFPFASFMEIKPNWIIESEKIIDVENALVRHERSYTIRHGDLINQFLKQNRHCTFLISNQDIEKIAFFEYNIIYKYYRRAYDMLRKGYKLNGHVYFVLEESQNSLAKSVLSSKLFRRYRKLFSEMRNMNMHAILLSQRIQDLSTYFRSRCSLGIGKISLDDYDLKVKRLLSPLGKETRNQVLDSPRGSFYFTSINETVAFPKWNSQKPNEFKPIIEKPQVEAKPKKEGLIHRIKDWFDWSGNVQDTEESNIYDDTEKDSDADIEDDALIGEDLFGEDW